MRLGFSIIAQPFSLNQYTVLISQLPSLCFIIQVMTVLKMPFQSCNSLALHQRTIKDAVLVMDKLTFQ